MGRTKGSKNKNSGEVPVYSTLPVEERLFVLANLIVDRIVEDHANGKELLKQIGGNHEAGTSKTT
jgi:hypothetical protein